MSTEKLVLQVQLDEDESLESVENVDGWVSLPDRSVWSATFITYRELGRILDRWRSTGESLAGGYFVCPDLIITREPGVDEMLAAVEDLLAIGGDLSLILSRVEEHDDS